MGIIYRYLPCFLSDTCNIVMNLAAIVEAQTEFWGYFLHFKVCGGISPTSK